MGFFDRFKTVKNEVVNPTQKKYKGALKRINLEQIYRTEEQIQDWLDALYYWEEVDNPDRYYMIKIYKDIELDGQVATKVKHIERSITAQDWQFCDANGEPLEVEMSHTNSDWFKALVSSFVGAEMEGYSLFEMIKSPEGYVTNLIPREYVQPEKGFIRVNRNDNQGLPMYSQKYANQMIYIGDIYEKGLFSVIAPLYIYKKNALQYWANYQNIFGVPPVVAKMDLTQEKLVDDVAIFLQDLKNKRFAITDLDTEIETFSGNSSVDAYKTFKELISYVDASISKILEGQTMTSDDGSSQSQAQVHAEVAKIALKSRLNDFVRLFNSQVVPFMVRDGYLPEGAYIKYIETKDTNEIIDQVAKLVGAGYFVDPEQVEKLTGYNLEVIREGLNTENLDNKFDA